MGLKVGFIGLGRMGLPMVGNLSRGGAQVVVYDQNPESCARAAEIDRVEVSGSCAAVARDVSVLFTCLPNDSIVRGVYLGDDGIADNATSGLVTCDCSTVSPEAAVELGQALSARGVLHLDTPMLGSEPQAQSGDIFFIVSGAKEAYAGVRTLLDSMGKKSMFVGAPGCANKIKLIHNALGAVNAVAVAESLALCIRGQVDPRMFYQVVCDGGGMAYSTYFDRRVARIADGNFEPTFTLDLMRKDVTMAAAMAEAWGVDAPILESARSAYDEGAAGGWGGMDFSAVSHVIEKKLGIDFSQPVPEQDEGD